MGFEPETYKDELHSLLPVLLKGHLALDLQKISGRQREVDGLGDQHRDVDDDPEAADHDAQVAQRKLRQGLVRHAPERACQAVVFGGKKRQVTIYPHVNSRDWCDQCDALDNIF